MSYLTSTGNVTHFAVGITGPNGEEVRYITSDFGEAVASVRQYQDYYKEACKEFSILWNAARNDPTALALAQTRLAPIIVKLYVYDNSQNVPLGFPFSYRGAKDMAKEDMPDGLIARIRRLGKKDQAFLSSYL